MLRRSGSEEFEDLRKRKEGRDGKKLPSRIWKFGEDAGLWETPGRGLPQDLKTGLSRKRE